MTFDDLWRERQRYNRWLQSKRLTIVPDRYIGLQEEKPYTLYAIRLRRGSPGPLDELPADWYEVIARREGVTGATDYQSEKELAQELFNRFGQVSIADAIPVDDGSQATVRRLLRRLRESGPEHVEARKRELEELQSRVEDALGNAEEHGRDTTLLEERQQAVEEALDALEKGNLQGAIDALDE